MKNDKLLDLIGDIDPAYIEAAEKGRTVRILNMRKRIVIIAAAAIALLLMGAGYSDFLGGWLSENVRWWVENDEVDPELRQMYLEVEIDGIIMKQYTERDNGDFIYEFTGASDAVYTDDGEMITIYALKSESSEFTLRIPEDTMYTSETREKIEENKRLHNQFIDNVFSYQSKSFQFIPVDALP